MGFLSLLQLRLIAGPSIIFSHDNGVWPDVHHGWSVYNLHSTSTSSTSKTSRDPRLESFSHSVFSEYSLQVRHFLWITIKEASLVPFFYNTNLFPSTDISYQPQNTTQHVPPDHLPSRLRARFDAHNLLCRCQRQQAVQKPHQAVDPVPATVRLHAAQVPATRLPI